MVNKLVGRKWRKKAFMVSSEMRDWPDTVASMRITVDLGGGVKQTLWRPDWDRVEK